MIAVLIDSRRRGASGRVAVREAQRLRVSGLDGDQVKVLYFNGEETLEHLFSRDCEVMLPPCTHVAAEHLMLGKGRVFVDLTR